MLGTVLDPTPVATFVQPTALALVTETTVEDGSGPHPLVRSLHADGSFLVRSSDLTLEIHPKEAIWGTTVCESTDPSRQKSPVREGERKVFEVERIPVGGKLLVAGRAKRQADGSLAVAAAGHGSLVMFATARDEKPRTVLEKALRQRRRSVFGLAAMALVTLLLLALFWSSLPPVYLGPSED